MLRGVGIDIVDLDRIREQIKKGDLFAKRVLTSKEFEQYQKYQENRQVEYLAGRFSCKESFSKAMGVGLGTIVKFKEVEIIDNDLGQPEMTAKSYHGRIFVSISHEKRYLVTQVVLEDI